jgi:hypothetical protein
VVKVEPESRTSNHDLGSMQILFAAHTIGGPLPARHMPSPKLQPEATRATSPKGACNHAGQVPLPAARPVHSPALHSPALQRQGRSATRRTRSPVCSPSVSPGSPLRAEFNASLNNSSEKSIKSTTSPRQNPAEEDSEPSSEPLWMDKMIHMLSETHMALASGISSPQATRGIFGLPDPGEEMNTIVGPALPRSPSTVSTPDSASPSPQLPFLAPQLLPNRARNVGGENESIFSTGLPTFMTNQHAAKKRGFGAKIVLEVCLSQACSFPFVLVSRLIRVGKKAS